MKAKLIKHKDYKALLKSDCYFPINCNHCQKNFTEDCYCIDDQMLCKSCYERKTCHSLTCKEESIMREADLVHYGLNLTSAMKKSYKKSSDDIFSIEQFNIRTINVSKTSLSSLNVQYLKKVIEYLAEIEKELKKGKKESITYKEIRYELQKRKTINLVQLRKTSL